MRLIAAALAMLLAGCAGQPPATVAPVVDACAVYIGSAHFFSDCH